jgi:hypothetical protein
VRIKSLAELPARYHIVPGCRTSGPTVKTVTTKYRNVPTIVDGQRFDSKLEAMCYEELKLRKQAGELWFFLRQVAFPLEGGIKYRCDFFVVLAGGGIEVLDAKGKDTQASINKRRQVKARYGIDVQLWTGK